MQPALLGATPAAHAAPPAGHATLPAAPAGAANPCGCLPSPCAGLGPTLEFYTLLSHELQRKSLGIWRHDGSSGGGAGGASALVEEAKQEAAAEAAADAAGAGGAAAAAAQAARAAAPGPLAGELDEGGGGGHSEGVRASELVCAPHGLFPAPLPPGQRGDESKPVALFRLLGRAVAKALQDGRLLDLPLSPVLYRLALQVGVRQGVDGSWGGERAARDVAMSGRCRITAGEQSAALASVASCYTWPLPSLFAAGLHLGALHMSVAAAPMPSLSLQRHVDLYDIRKFDAALGGPALLSGRACVRSVLAGSRDGARSLPCAAAHAASPACLPASPTVAFCIPPPPPPPNPQALPWSACTPPTMRTRPQGGAALCWSTAAPWTTSASRLSCPASPPTRCIQRGQRWAGRRGAGCRGCGGWRCPCWPLHQYPCIQILVLLFLNFKLRSHPSLPPPPPVSGPRHRRQPAAVP